MGGSLGKDLTRDTGWFALSMVKTSQLQSANDKAVRDLFCVCVNIKCDPKCKNVLVMEHASSCLEP